ncbi:MAG TPA: biotin/lipoyl-containing protein, partial [Polyangiaceae bacterium]|nr:biotin/lipoyl-containing protein [Polyangiaceae bacterium]
MARWEFKLPDIGEGITEGEIVGWLVKPGDAVKEDQPVVEVMTDKATVTITAPKAGTVVETRGKVGDVVAVHSVLVVFDLVGAATPSTGHHAANGSTGRDDGPAASAVGDLKDTLPGLSTRADALASRPPDHGAATASSGYFNDKPLATPATRKLARDMSIDLRRVPPTGPQGRVTKGDLESFARSPAAPISGRPAAGAPAALQQARGAAAPSRRP